MSPLWMMTLQPAFGAVRSAQACNVSPQRQWGEAPTYPCAAGVMSHVCVPGGLADQAWSEAGW